MDARRSTRGKFRVMIMMIEEMESIQSEERERPEPNEARERLAMSEAGARPAHNKSEDDEGQPNPRYLSNDEMDNATRVTATSILLRRERELGNAEGMRIKLHHRRPSR